LNVWIGGHGHRHLGGLRRVAENGYACGHGLEGVIPVDVYLPGCPAGENATTRIYETTVTDDDLKSMMASSDFRNRNYELLQAPMSEGK